MRRPSLFSCRHIGAFAALLALMTISAALPAAAAAGKAAGSKAKALPAAAAAGSNPIVLENQQPGTSAWDMNNLSGTVATDTGGQIKGYANAVSVNKGQSITFYVSVAPAQTFTIDVYRIGWYQGLGGRLMQHIGPLNGTKQPTCPTDPSTGEIACNWAPAYTLATQTTWTSGVYEAILTNAANYLNAIIFVVRDDGRGAALLYQQPVNTYQAYNGYPANGKTGKSLYEYNSYGANTVTGTARAAKVSFDRPYEGAGYSDFEEWEINFVRWMEKNGYDVTYSTDVDTDTNGASLLNYRGFLSVGHNEYWSKNMYDAAINALAGGVNLGFFGANAIYWQVRYESSASGVRDRVLVCYKDASIDPTTDPSTTTVQWGDPILNRPEQSLIGVMYENQTKSFETYIPYVVTNASDWIYAGTGFKDGDSVPGLVGYETDQQSSSYPLPNAVPGTYKTISNSPFTNIEGQPDHANSSIYQAPSGAWVFGAGTIGWSWGLDNYGERGRVDPRIQQTTANILNQFSQPLSPTVVTEPASALTQTSASLNATVNPNGGEVSECKFEYGTTTAYGSSAACTSSPGSGSSPVAVSAAVTGLTANTTYHFRVSATNAGGTSKGSDQTFKTLPNAPTVVTGTASSIARTSATLNATVNPNGGEVSECKLEYGTTTAYGSSAPCTPPPGAGESPVAVSAAVTGLAPNTTYHFRINATNAGGARSGSDQTFATLLPNPPTFATSFGPANNIEGSFNEPNGVALDPSANIWVADSAHNRVLEFDKERKFLRQFGTEGSGEGQFRGIQGIATNSSGDVYVSGSDRVQEFSPTGAFLRQFGSPGSGNGQFLYPNGVAVDASGNVWVLDTFNYRVQEFSPSGAYLGQFGSKGTGNGQLGWASGLAFAGGNLYVADSSRVQEFSTAGTYLAQFGSSGSGNGQFHGLGGIASDPTTGNLYVSDIGNNRVQEFSAAGAFIATFGSGGSGAGQFSGPRGLAVNASGTLYVADTANNRIEEWLAPLSSGEPPTFATSFTPVNIEGSFNEPNGVALDPSANIWVADSAHNRVLEFDKERKFLRQFGTEGSGEGQFRGIQGIATNSSGDVYVSGSDRVQEFSPTGAFLRQFGSPGSGNGQFLYPAGVAVDASGNVWVLDTFNYRVQEFSPSGAYLSQFGSQGTGNGQLGWASGLAFAGGNLYVADSSRVQEFSTAGTYLAQFGSSGSGNGQFHGLGGIASDPTTGNLYVSDIGNNRVQEFSSSGAFVGFIATFGSGGSGAGQFSGPRGLAVNSSGSLYVADTGNNRVQEWVASP